MIPIRSCHPNATYSLIFELWEHVLWRISVRRYNLIVHATAKKNPEEVSRDFFTKIRDPLDEEPSPLHLGQGPKEGRRAPTRHARQQCPTKMEPSRHKPVMISHHWPIVPRKRLELWKKYFIDDVPTKTPLILPPIARCKKRVSECKVVVSDQNKYSKTSKITVESHPPP